MRQTARVRERMGNLEKKKRGGKERCSDASAVKKSISVEFARKIPRIFGPTYLFVILLRRENEYYPRYT